MLDHPCQMAQCLQSLVLLDLCQVAYVVHRLSRDQRVAFDSGRVCGPGWCINSCLSMLKLLAGGDTFHLWTFEMRFSIQMASWS